MKYLIVILGFLFVLISCKKDTYYELRIGITNSLNKEIQVTLFPKSQFIHGDLYKSSTNSSGYSKMDFNLISNDSEILFYTDKLDYSPNGLLIDVFDSLIITTNIDSVITIRFKPNFVYNYKTNMFESSSGWTYKMIDADEKTNFSSKRVVVYDYKFEIKQDSIIMKK